ncbi:uracil-DNA glycosylase [Croceicoccus sp. F390]|uniref:Uracil-DNA glycosylase n=1 Tax=Croceicoccus esteveae TaxID=3075597 RepID=A0ABU2ZJI1_9SPHN|nr:uracil-DNA glycosylase [Croceicoccus sp. F390]MDT0575714.1 uracil-DNA glycosylase [Croceicoccus sp. F390]
MSLPIERPNNRICNSQVAASHQVTGHQVTGHQVTGHEVIGHQATDPEFAGPQCTASQFPDAVPGSWAGILQPVQQEMRAIAEWLRLQADSGAIIYPAAGDRLRALELTAPDMVRVVILGQDPYHGPGKRVAGQNNADVGKPDQGSAGQAHGLSFSVPHGQRLPPSLRNIYKELAADCGIIPPASGDLTRWAEQGVLLLNDVLTVEAGRAASHRKEGWEAVTDAIVSAVATTQSPSVFILWGSHAQAKAERIPALGADSIHCIIRSPHPSPLSAHRGFFGSRPFSRANAFLEANGRGRITW